MPVNTREARRILAERLGSALNLTPEKVEEFKYLCTAAGYFRLHDHEGGVMMPGTKHYRRSREFTYNDVPWKAILEAAESTIKRTADDDDRTGVFEEVMRGLPGRKSTPEWAKPSVNPNAKPMTFYSRYRTKEGEEPPSNAQMLKYFGEAAGLDESSLSFVSAQIVWWDAMGDDNKSPTLGPAKRNHTTAISSRSDAASTTTLGSPTTPRWGVSGGRLGRDHTFADVPSHYARDRLIHYTITHLDSDMHDRVLAALCPDLNQAQIATYSKCIAEDRVMSEEDEESGPGLEDGESEGHVPRDRDGNRGIKRASQGGEHIGKGTKRAKALDSEARKLRPRPAKKN
ncbi:hypothetical protein NUW58_g4619 [Xylaria curta]|uniref:Uncharacterized protein n=1 Tax=Xylaria curta TaxID=42375 RepID=A0ACC1P786_9PEZI|nr:hypothetical protein NUW58_g4619 [Xylaria curta]